MSYEPYAGSHRKKSSKIEIFPAAGYIRKIRPGRSEKSVKNEVMALIAWRNVLEHYSPENPDDIRSLQSPYVVSYSLSKGEITMTFCKGVEYHAAMAKGKDKDIQSTMDRIERTERIAFGLGRLAAIKSDEKIKHGDYGRRHILFNPFDTVTKLCEPRISVIDVESTELGSEDDVKNENEKMRKDLYSIFSQGKMNVKVNEAYNEGLGSLFHGRDTVWGDAYNTARDEFGLS